MAACFCTGACKRWPFTCSGYPDWSKSGVYPLTVGPATPPECWPAIPHDPQPPPRPNSAQPVRHLTEDDVRRIIREELERHTGGSGGSL